MFEIFDESFKLLRDLVKPVEPAKPQHENGDANIRRYHFRDRVKPKYLNDHVTWEDLDDAVR